jgi:hypothetical protein
MDILAAMLEKLSPQQKASLGENDPSPLAYAFGGYEGSDPRIVRLLLAAGQSAAKLDANALVSAVRDDDPTLVIDLLDHGAVVREKAADADDVNALASKLLVHAISKGNPALLSRLLAEGARPNYRSDDGWTAVELAIYSGNKVTLDLLLANGGRIDTSPTDLNPVASSALDLAVYSNDEEMVLRIALLWGGLSQACLKHDEWLMAIALYSPDSYWKLLMSNGLATPSSAAGNCEKLSPMAERIVNQLLEEPSTVITGWLSKRLVARLNDLWRQASFLRWLCRSSPLRSFSEHTKRRHQYRSRSRQYPGSFYDKTPNTSALSLLPELCLPDQASGRPVSGHPGSRRSRAGDPGGLVPHLRETRCGHHSYSLAGSDQIGNETRSSVRKPLEPVHECYLRL